ncbi:MAG TPA: MBL fold metallo-hydrolase [bacterium (Candidatus Stahlbacteria)]|nr:MBL fold metallo-hydrolase [Candidatus Stahlbacteria bacterium]
MKLKFLGGVGTVTGSKHIVEVDDKRLLLDFGLFQGHRQEARKINSNIPFELDSVESMILSHAHIDHSGNIPTLAKNDYKGTIYTTFATRDICAVMLKDSAHIQEKDAEYVNKRHREKGLPLIEPLYTAEDAVESMKLFVGYGYNRWFYANDLIKAMFVDAGHILGSALTLLEIKDKDKIKRLAYVVDLGRRDLPILRDPQQITNLDYLIIESTYGDRYHVDILQAKSMLAKVVNNTIGRGGKIIVPAFALGRAQEIVYLIRKLRDEKRIPEFPVYVDSPLAVNVTEVFRLHPECFDEEANKLFVNFEDPLGFDDLTYIRDVEKSKRLNEDKTPSMIISASGMCEAGRVLHHLKNNIEDPKNTIMIVGFMAQHTLGRRIADGVSEIRIFDETYRVNAEVVTMDVFSAHADRRELLDYVGGARQRLKGIFLVHGEAQQAESLAQGIKELGINEVFIPSINEEVTL